MTGHKLALVPVEPYACCMPWHGRGVFQPEPEHGGRCCFCSRDIAVPESARGKNNACIYCGMDRGFIPEQEIEP